MDELEMDEDVLVCAIKEINILPQKDREVRVSHNYREGNRSADWLANAGFSTCIEIHDLFRTLLGWLCPVFVMCDFFSLEFYREKTTRHDIIDRETRQYT